MLLKILLIALIVYVIVVTRARVRLPHPGLQATVDVLQAATLPQAIRMPNGSSG